MNFYFYFFSYFGSFLFSRMGYRTLIKIHVSKGSSMRWILGCKGKCWWLCGVIDHAEQHIQRWEGGRHGFMMNIDLVGNFIVVNEGWHEMESEKAWHGSFSTRNGHIEVKQVVITMYFDIQKGLEKVWGVYLVYGQRYGWYTMNFWMKNEGQMRVKKKKSDTSSNSVNITTLSL